MTQGASFQHVAAELRLYCGGDSLAALGKELKRNGCGRAVVVSGRSVAKSGAMALLRSALGPVLVGESQSVQPNSPVRAVEEVTAMLRDGQAAARSACRAWQNSGRSSQRPGRRACVAAWRPHAGRAACWNSACA
jgi:hypothetical protein